MNEEHAGEPIYCLPQKQLNLLNRLAERSENGIYRHIHRCVMLIILLSKMVVGIRYKSFLEYFMKVRQ